MGARQRLRQVAGRGCVAAPLGVLRQAFCAGASEREQRNRARSQQWAPLSAAHSGTGAALLAEWCAACDLWRGRALVGGQASGASLKYGAIRASCSTGQRLRTVVLRQVRRSTKAEVVERRHALFKRFNNRRGADKDGTLLLGRVPAAQQG